jgi:hypothetical protein
MIALLLEAYARILYFYLDKGSLQQFLNHVIKPPLFQCQLEFRMTVRLYSIQGVPHQTRFS